MRVPIASVRAVNANVVEWQRRCPKLWSEVIASLDHAFPFRKRPHFDAVPNTRNIAGTNAQLTDTRLDIMAKTYKEMKEAWVSGHTGSSVADVNSVSLAMPVPYTLPMLLQ